MFGIRPDHNLDVIRPRQSLHGLTARVLERLSPALQQVRPDAVVVQGDTTSAFAGALAAFYEQIPVVHAARRDQVPGQRGSVGELPVHPLKALHDSHCPR